MPPVLPFVPENITVHLAGPSTPAANVTLPFSDYVKNVASSEIYPTWDDNALRANIYAIVSFALNRVYTEFYRSRGYDFDITNSTAYDQAFVNGRSYFENISRIVDSLFNDYLRRPGFVEPLAAKFCNGTTVTCQGLSQWGSQNLARQGYDEVQILRSYYGNVEIVNNAPIQGITSSYPGTPLRRGTSGPSVVTVQVMLNRIGQNYPAIPKLATVDGIYGSRTEAAVRKFQQIFGLTADGIVGKATWYAMVRLYVAVTSLAELRSRGGLKASMSFSPDFTRSLLKVSPMASPMACTSLISPTKVSRTWPSFWKSSLLASKYNPAAPIGETKLNFCKWSAAILSVKCPSIPAALNTCSKALALASRRLSCPLRKP